MILPILIGLAIAGIAGAMTTIAIVKTQPEAHRDYAYMLTFLKLHGRRRGQAWNARTIRSIANHWFGTAGALVIDRSGDRPNIIDVSYNGVPLDAKRRIKRILQDLYEQEVLHFEALNKGIDSTYWHGMRVNSDGSIDYGLTGGTEDWGLAIRLVLQVLTALVVTVLTSGAAWETLAAAVIDAGVEIYYNEYADGSEAVDKHTIKEYTSLIFDASNTFEEAYSVGGKERVLEVSDAYVTDYLGYDR